MGKKKEYPMPGLFLGEDIALTICLIIQNQPDTSLECADLIRYRNGNITQGNARKNLSTLRKMGILDDAGIPTTLGKRWANPKTREAATKAILSSFFPDEILLNAESFKSNSDIADWLVNNGFQSKSVAHKNASILKIMLRLAEKAKTEHPSRKQTPIDPSPQITSSYIEVSKELDEKSMLKAFKLAKQAGMNIRLV